MISVVICSMSRQFLLNRCLESVQKQDLHIADNEIYILDTKLKIARLDGVRRTSQELVLFLDEDCELPDSQYLNRLQRAYQMSDKKSILGGCYLNSRQAGYSAKAYNSLCNSWVLSTGQDQTIENLLGGCLAIPRKILDQNTLNECTSWGGEDTFLLRQLQKGGVRLTLLRELDVVHHAQGTIAKWIRRGFRQGYHREKYFLSSKKKNFSTRLLYQGVVFFPYYFMHFLSLFGGMLFFRALNSNHHKSKKA